jgi:hypothetical protein
MLSSGHLRGVIRNACLCAAGVFLSAIANAQEVVQRPEAAGRVVRLFDFEEHETNPGEVPRYWYRDQDDPNEPLTSAHAGFPEWNKADLSYVTEGGIALNGIGSVRLPTQGGSTRLVLEPGVLPVFDNADYLVSARVHTENLTHARARLRAYMLDKNGKQIRESIAESELMLSPDGWQQVSVSLPGSFITAAYIQLELVLLQPSEIAAMGHGAGAAPASKAIVEQDLDGAAYFDDVAITQLPRVDLTTNSPINVLTRSQRPELRIFIRDLAGEVLDGTLVVYDVNGIVVDRWSGKVAGGLTSESWSPKLPRLGWYRARLDLIGPGGFRVGGAGCDFVWLADPSDRSDAPGTVGNHDRRRFGVSVDSLPVGLRPLLPDLIRAGGTGSVTLPVWNSQLTSSDVAQEAHTMQPLVGLLLRDWQELTLSLDPVPDTLAAKAHVHPEDAWAVLEQDDAVWLPYIDTLLEKLGQRVTRWQIGRTGDDRLFWTGTVREQALSLQNKLAKFVPGPTIVIPARADRDWNGSMLRAGEETPAISLLATPDAGPRAVREMVSAWQSSLSPGRGPVPHTTIVLEPYGDRYSPAASASDLAKRAVEFWASVDPKDTSSAPLAMSIPSPWRFVGDTHGTPQPSAHFAVWRNIVDRLSDRRVVGTYPVGDGSDAIASYILGPTDRSREHRTGMLVAWNRSANPDAAVIKAHLGTTPLTVYDLYGNARSPEMIATTPNGPRNIAVIPLGEDPVFIEGVDVELLQFVASLKIDPSFLEWNVDDAQHAVHVTNPWPFAVAGKISILEPGGYQSGKRDRSWRILPRQLAFTTQSDETAKLPFRASFGPGEEAGPKEFVFEVALNADKTYPPIEVRRLVELGLRDVSMSLATSTQGRTLNDLVVEVTLTNNAKKPLTLDLTCFAPGQPRSRSVVPELKPGAQTVRRFVYPNAAQQARGRSLIVTMTESESGRRLNQSLKID